MLWALAATNYGLLWICVKSGAAVAALKYDILTRWRDAARLRPQQAAVVVVAVNSYFKNILLCIGTYKTFLNWPRRKI